METERYSCERDAKKVINRALGDDRFVSPEAAHTGL